ncbi:ARSB [Mytilus coruscus]|uniref:ARSB n=1 Tax=Mytilus coruscus TaxID=42192 RepID=A0A6J8B731_MYTCO|nr:ARSB [Mytilus coruscus]
MMDVFVYGLLLLSLSKCVESKSPHIVFIVADDLGWNDVGFHNPAIISPNINYLAKHGMILNNSYVQPVCSPLRNAFLSGFYPFKSGLQNFVILPQAPSCAPLNRTLLPQKLKELGYATHMIGKWHLGMCKWECTPTYRGFDTFYGYYNGKEDYYNYTVLNGTDFRDNKEPIRPNEYSTYAYARRADKIITQHNKSQPMFLYLPFQSVHQPIQVPEIYENMYEDIKNDGRRKFSGMVTALDDAIGNVTASLKRNEMFEDTLIIFTSDNGGMPSYSGNNYPLRGGKATIYEGGTRASAFVYGLGLQKPNTVFDGMIHAVDWMPTILSAAGGGQVSGIDGLNMWPSISEGVPSSLRSEFIYNLDDSLVPIMGRAAIRMGDFKLIEGFAGTYNGWYPVPENEEDAKIDEPKVDYYQLYNLRDDPNERNNLHTKEHSMLKKMKERLNEYRKYIVPPVTEKPDPASNPNKYNGYWTPGWC